MCYLFVILFSRSFRIKILRELFDIALYYKYFTPRQSVQLTSLRAGSYEIDYILVFSNSFHHFHF